MEKEMISFFMKERRGEERRRKEKRGEERRGEERRGELIGTRGRFMRSIIKIANITNDLIDLMSFAIFPRSVVNTKQLIVDIHRT
jgi:hypothetical protein